MEVCPDVNFILVVAAFRVSLLLRSLGCNSVNRYRVLSVLSDWSGYCFIPTGQRRNLPPAAYYLEGRVELRLLDGELLISSLDCFPRTGLDTSITGWGSVPNKHHLIRGWPIQGKRKMTFYGRVSGIGF